LESFFILLFTRKKKEKKAKHNIQYGIWSFAKVNAPHSFEQVFTSLSGRIGNNLSNLHAAVLCDMVDNRIGIEGC
jgi:hypothetical protein